MTTSPTRVRARLLAGLATTALLGAGLACADSSAYGAGPSAPLGFPVASLAATADGAEVVAIGTSYDDATETETARAALVRQHQVVPVEGIPASAHLYAVAVNETDTGEVAVLGGITDNGAALWEVDLSAEAPVAESVATPEWDVVTAAAGGAFPVLAGTVFHDDGSYTTVVDGPDGEVPIADNNSASAVTANAQGTFVVGQGDEPGAKLWVAHGTDVETYDVGGFPTGLVASGDTAVVASNTDEGEGSLHLIDTSGGSSTTVDFGPDNGISGLTISADGETVYAAVNDWAHGQYKIHAIPVADAAAYDVTTDDAEYANGPLGAVVASESDGLTTVFSSQYDDTAETDTVVGYDIYGDLVAPDAKASVVGAPASAVVGQTLTGQTSGWPEGTLVVDEGWVISGGEWGDYHEGTTVKLTSDWVGAKARYRAVGVKHGDRLIVESAPVAIKAATVVHPAPLPVTKKAVAKVSGTAKVGKTIKAATGTWPKGTTLKVQWLSNGKPVKGATKTKLKLTKKLKGKKVSVVVTGTKPGYAPKVIKSKAVKVS